MATWKATHSSYPCQRTGQPFSHSVPNDRAPRMIRRDGQDFERIDGRGLQYAMGRARWLQTNDPERNYTVHLIA